MIRLFLCVLLLMPTHVIAGDFRVGVREDAVSMSYKVTKSKRGGGGSAFGPLAKAGFDGFVVHICDSVLTDMQTIYGAKLNVQAVPVTAANMWEKFANDELDIVCGPITATRDRLQGRIASPPIFVSGVSYASRARLEVRECAAILGYLGSSTAGNTALRTMMENGVWRSEDADVLNEFLSGGENWKAQFKDCASTYQPIQIFETHDKLADAFCEGNLKYYIGDFEIMARSLQAAKARSVNGCDYVLSDQTFSEERYVVLAQTRFGNQQPSNSLVAHFFEILSRKLFFQPSVVDSAFENSFPFAKPSRKLEFLFWALRGSRKR